MTKKTVCVDLDGTLSFYDGWKGEDHFGDPLPGAVEFTKQLSEFAKVIIYTTRCNADVVGRPADVTPEILQQKVKDYLDKHGFYYDEIYIGQGKPFCAAFVDDRAVAIFPNPEKEHYSVALESVRELLRN